MADQHDALAPHVERHRSEHAEHDEVAGRRALSQRPATQPTRSNHHTNTATAAALGNSESSWSVWLSSTATVASTAVMASASEAPGRRRTMPWTSTSHTQKQATIDELEPVVVEPHRCTNGDSRSGQPHG